MNRLIEEKRGELTRLCAECRVHRLELFGWGVTHEFDPNRSDLDFLGEFLPLQPGEHADTHIGLLETLQELFHRNVDLVMTSGTRNSYFLESVNRRRTLLHAD